MNFLDQIDKNKLPQHVAIIMDGNGRWAKNKGKLRIFGHQSGVLAVRDVVEGAVLAGIKYVTLYTFSTENWNRPKFEVNALMELLVATISKETKTLTANGVRLNIIGDMSQLPSRCRSQLEKAMDETANNTVCTLTLALSYSSRMEILSAVKNLIQDVQNQKVLLEDVNESVFSKYLMTYNIPDPELLIRTSGEFRVSNYLLWQIAYAELYFTEKLWPDFRREDLFEAIVDFQHRERRFGLTSEQI